MASGVSQTPASEPSHRLSQSTFSTLVTVLKGRITVLCEAKDETGKRLDGTHGELVLDVEQGTIFSVAQYRGQPGLGYFCLEAEKATLYHRGVGATAAYIKQGRGISGGLCSGSSLNWTRFFFSQRPLRTTHCPITWKYPALLPQLSWLQPSTHQRKG